MTPKSTEIPKKHRGIISSMRELAENIKAEVIVADLLRGGNYQPEQISIKNQGGHKRGFAGDIEKTRLKSADKGSFGLELDLNRDSIYDVLPESFFHPKVKHEYGRGNAAIMIEEYKKHKKEESLARQFFAPIENEIFHHRIAVEQMETEQLLKIGKRELKLSFFDLSNIDSRLPKKLCRKWISLLPFLQFLVGNIEQLANCLAFLLNEKVWIEQNASKEDTFHKNNERLGECRLGENMLLGSKFNAYFDNYCFVIEDLSAKKASRFVKGCEYFKFMQVFIDTFIPLNVDASWRVCIKKEEHWEINSSKKHSSILNYSTTI